MVHAVLDVGLPPKTSSPVHPTNVRTYVGCSTMINFTRNHSYLFYPRSVAKILATFRANKEICNGSVAAWRGQFWPCKTFLVRQYSTILYKFDPAKLFLLDNIVPYWTYFFGRQYNTKYYQLNIRLCRRVTTNGWVSIQGTGREYNNPVATANVVMTS